LIFGIANIRSVRAKNDIINSFLRNNSLPLIEDNLKFKNCSTANFIVGSKYVPHLENNISFFQLRNRYTIVSFARLDNVDELKKKLKILNVESNLSEILLDAYLTWGINCTKHIIGDWSFAIWDHNNEELFIARDHLGYSSIYYYVDNGEFVFCSNLKELVAFKTTPNEINPNAILQLSQGIKADSQTFYKGIFQIPAAHTLSYKNGDVSISNYWLPSEIKSISYSNDEDYLHHFIEIYDQAVKSRLDSKKIGIMLSSGLDSSSIAALATPFFAQNNRMLEAYTWKPNIIDDVFIGKNRIPDETPLVEHIVDHLGHINLNVVLGQPTNFVHTMNQSLNIFGEPKNINLIALDILEAARLNGIEVLLNGEQGNYTVSYKGNLSQYFRTLLTETTNRNLFKELFSWKKEMQISWKHIFHKILLQPLMDSLSYIEIANKKTINLGHIKSNYLNSNAILENNSNYHSVTPHLKDVNKSAHDNRRAIFTNFLRNNSFGTTSLIYSYYGIEARCPVMDKRLIEYCFGIPNNQYIGNGNSKSILKRAMHNKLPPQILYNKGRGVQSANAISKIKQEKGYILKILEKFRKSDIANYWVNVDQLKIALNKITDPSTLSNGENPYLYIHCLKGGVRLGLFLEQFENG